MDISTGLIGREEKSLNMTMEDGNREEREEEKSLYVVV